MKEFKDAMEQFIAESDTSCRDVGHVAWDVMWSWNVCNTDHTLVQCADR